MSNAIQPLFDVFWDSGTIFFKWLFDGWIKEKKDINLFFQSVGLKNKLDQFPHKLQECDGSITVSIPVGLNLKDFEKHLEGLEIYLDKKINLTLNKGTILIEFIKDLPTKVDYATPSQSGELIIPVAATRTGTVSINFKNETPHVLITGTTGSGKSITLRSILTSIISLYPNNIELVLIDFKIVELSIFKKLKQVVSYTTDVENAKEIISSELEECNRRYKLFEEVGVTNIYDYNSKVSKDKQLKYRFIVIEEFVMLLADKKKIAMTMLKQLACLSRASGQFLIITGQRFDNTVIDLVLRANIGCRLVHKMEDQANSMLILDRPGAEKLRGNGHMLVKQGSVFNESQGFYITDKQIKKVIGPYITVRGNRIKSKELKEEKGNSIQEENKITDLSFLDNI